MPRNNRGAVSVPCAFGLVVVMIAGWGIWGVLRHWRFQAETQLRLDRCITEKVRSMKRTLALLESSNTRMKWERRATVVTVFAPPAEETRRVILEGELAFQELLYLKWQAERVAWLAGRACADSARGDRPLWMSGLSWERLPPDALGPQPYRWTEEKPEFRIRIRNSPRSSNARIAMGEKNEWKAEWTGLR